jgi:hypothetical protein
MEFVNVRVEGENTVKRITKVSGHSLKSHFCMFEISQRKHKNLNCHNFLEIFFINCKVYMLKVRHKSKIFFACLNESNLENE